jgi:NADH:ubiquinone oxidoreductase subunit E
MAVQVQDKSDMISVVQAAVAQHGATQEALIPILREVNEKLGYLPAEALSEISRLLRLPSGHLGSVASFYRLLSTRPRGKHVIQCCESAPCHVMGGRRIWPTLREALNLEPGDTSADGEWTLLAISCPGLCGVGPVMIVDDDIYGNLTPELVSEILGRYR